MCFVDGRIIVQHPGNSSVYAICASREECLDYLDISTADCHCSDSHCNVADPHSAKTTNPMITAEEPTVIEGSPEDHIYFYTISSSGEEVYIPELHVSFKQIQPATEYTCIGEGEAMNGTDYCEQHECRPNGTKICLQTKAEHVVLKQEGQEMNITGYGFFLGSRRSVPFFPDGRAHIEVSCAQWGIYIHIDAGDTTYTRVCISGSCVTFEMDGNYTVCPPRQFLVVEQRYDIYHSTQHLDIVCPAKDVCTLVSCYWCMETIHNWRCRKLFFFCFTAITVMGAALVIGIDRLLHCLLVRLRRTRNEEADSLPDPEGIILQSLE